MKKLFLFFFTLFIFDCRAQDVVSIGIVGEYSENFSIRNYSGGIQVEVPVGEKFTLNYRGVFGASSDRAFYLHAPLGAATGSVILHYLGGSDTKIINMLGAILFVIPEGVTFYPNPDAKIRTGIYLAPLGCDYWRKKNNYEYFKVSGELGARIKFGLGDGKADVFIQGGLRYLYGKKQVDPVFIHAGAGIALNID